jgi:hypothetical protein
MAPPDFMCESEVFNGAKCKRQCKRCAPKMGTRPSAQWADYEIRTGNDGKIGIYTRDYNVRLATFNANTHVLQTRLKLLFDLAHKRESEHK